MSFVHKFRAWCWHWHQRLGVSSALLFVVIAVTGIMLNHTSALQLAKHQVNQTWLIEWYGLAKQKQMSIEMPAGLIRQQKQQVLLNNQFLASCDAPLVSAAPTVLGDVVACRDSLLVVGPDGQLLDVITADYGLPFPISAMQKCQGNVLSMIVDTQTLLFDIESLSVLKDAQSCSGDQYPRVETLVVEGDGLDWQKVIQDLHSGRFFGTLGVWIYDLATLALLFLSLSGFWLWYNRRRRSK